MTTKFKEQSPFAVHRAAVGLLQVVLDGRGYDTVNPYARPEFKDALVALAKSCGVNSWMDTEAIFQNAPLEGAVHSELCALAKMFILGDNYETKNPYARPEVKGLLRALADDTGVPDLLDTKTIFERVCDPEMASLKKMEASRKNSLFNERVLHADIAFLTADMKCRVATIGEWAPLDNQDAISIGLALAGDNGEETLDEKGFFTAYFLPESATVLKIEAMLVDTAESLLKDKPKTLPAMGI